MTREGRNFPGKLSDLVAEEEMDDGCKVDLNARENQGTHGRHLRNIGTQRQTGMNESRKEDL